MWKQFKEEKYLYTDNIFVKADEIKTKFCVKAT